MARQVVWTAPAEKDRKEILAYWLQRNGTPTYSLKLFNLFRTALRELSMHPFMGRPTDIAGVRVRPVGDYLLFYEVAADAIIVHHIWHGRRDIKKLRF